MMRLKKIFYCILILVLALTATTGCKKEETELAAIELVPEHANNNWQYKIESNPK